LPEKWQRLSLEHESAGKLLREIVIARLRSVQADMEAGERVWHTEIRSLGETLVRAVELERQAVSQDYLDKTRAVQRVEQLGFLISRKGGAIEIASEHIQND
jgi:hypothetical protein